MKPTRWLLTFALLTILLSVALFVHATCVPSDTGTAGNDTINCDVANSPTGDVTGQSGDDVIYIDAGATLPFGMNIGGDVLTGAAGTNNDIIVNNGSTNGDIYGDSVTGNGSGNDTIINNGTVNVVYGDTFSGTSTGNDNITNNGTVGVILGDSLNAGGSGSDTITNNGVVNGSIVGDSSSGTSTGNDVIVNNGYVAGWIYGDDGLGAGTGDDTIINGGTINGGGVSIIAGGGNDTVIIQSNTAQNTGTMDGGTGYDVLTFNLTSSDPAVLLDAAQRLAAANPNGGTITLAGHTYTWTNFEELSQLIFSLARLNGLMDPLAVFCALSGGVDVYLVSGQQGIFSVNVSEQTISNGLAQATSSRVQIGSSVTATVYALATGELEVVAPNGFSFSFTYQTYCGTLPAPTSGEGSIQTEEEGLPPYSIINQPYGGG